MGKKDIQNLWDNIQRKLDTPRFPGKFEVVCSDGIVTLGTNEDVVWKTSADIFLELLTEGKFLELVKNGDIRLVKGDKKLQGEVQMLRQQKHIDNILGEMKTEVIIEVCPIAVSEGCLREDCGWYKIKDGEPYCRFLKREVASKDLSIKEN